MTSPHLSFALGEAHRAELGRQAERYRRRPAAAQRGTRSTSISLRSALLRFGEALHRRAGAPEITLTASRAAAGERQVRVETADSAA
jgi:hypothetical protein